MSKLFDLSGKRILITGASSGFGAHFAEVLASHGADVVLAARRVDKLEETAARVRSLGRQATVVAMDVASVASVDQAFKDMPALDVVINNAGINREGASHELSEDDWDAVLDTNVKGVWAVSRAAITRWIADKKPGNIVNIASVLGIRVANKVGVYATSKAAVVQLTKTVALDYARNQVRCNVLCPGYFETDINRDFMQTEAGQKQVKRIPYKRMGRMPELDGPLVLLCSDASSYMSGAEVAVDGAHLCATI